jgi:hypothetical protein
MPELESDLEKGVAFRRFSGGTVVKSHTGKYRLCKIDREFSGRTNYIYIITDEDGKLVLMDSGHEPFDKEDALVEYMNTRLDVKKFWEK